MLDSDLRVLWFTLQQLGIPAAADENKIIKSRSIYLEKSDPILNWRRACYLEKSDPILNWPVPERVTSEQTGRQKTLSGVSQNLHL